MEKLIQQKIDAIPREYKNSMKIAASHLKNALDNQLALKITMTSAQLQSRFGVIIKEIDDFNGLIFDKKFNAYFEEHPELVIAMKEMQLNAASFLLHLNQFLARLALQAKTNNQLKTAYNRMQNKWMENIERKDKAVALQSEQPKLTTEGKKRVNRFKIDDFLENHFHETSEVGQLFE